MLAQVFLVGGARLGLAPLRRQFPSLRFQLTPPQATGLPWVEPGEFFRRSDTWLADRALAKAIRRTHALAIDVSEEGADGALKLCTRLQRLTNRRNASSCSARFDAVLARHRALHDLQQPLVEVAWESALDAWQWLLRLEPSAGLALQTAMLFYDVEPSRSPTSGAMDVRATLAGVLRDEDLDEVARLLEPHHPREPHPARALLDDAAGLSFLSLGASGVLDAHGAAHAARTIARSLERLSPGARACLRQIGFRPDVRALVEGAALDGDTAPLPDGGIPGERHLAE